MITAAVRRVLRVSRQFLPVCVGAMNVNDYEMIQIKTFPLHSRVLKAILESSLEKRVRFDKKIQLEGSFQ